MLTSQIHLDTRHRERRLAAQFARRCLPAPTDVIVAAEFEHVRHQVVTLNDQVLNHGIHLGIAVLDAWQRNVSDILEQVREDDVGEVLDKVRLEGGVALLVGAEVVEQLLHRRGEAFVLLVLVELLGQKLDLVKDPMGMVAIALAEQKLALVVKTVELVVDLIPEDVALLAEALAHITVDLLEPSLELGVAIRITVKGVDAVEQIVEGRGVGKALDEELRHRQP